MAPSAHTNTMHRIEVAVAFVVAATVCWVREVALSCASERCCRVGGLTAGTHDTNALWVKVGDRCAAAWIGFQVFITRIKTVTVVGVSKEAGGRTHEFCWIGTEVSRTHTVNRVERAFALYACSGDRF